MSETSSNMQGKVVLITGGTNGIGKAAALALAKMGANVVIVGRSRDKAETVVNAIKTVSGSTSVSYLLADLSLMAGVRALAAEFRSRYSRLNVLLNNAGAFFSKRELTAEGHEMTWALNHLSYFLLTDLLLDSLMTTAQTDGEARIINVSSGAHMGGSINFDDPEYQHTRYMGFGAYSRSKLANVMFTYELARRLAGSNVTANALHPGAVATGFASNNRDLFALGWKVMSPFLLSPEQGARTSVYLASSPEVRGITGAYFDNSRLARSSKASYDEAAQRRLWEISAAAVGEPAMVGV